MNHTTKLDQSGGYLSTIQFSLALGLFFGTEYYSLLPRKGLYLALYIAVPSILQTLAHITVDRPIVHNTLIFQPRSCASLT
jgi:hypothetical protein